MTSRRPEGVIGTRCEQDEEMERGWLAGFLEACEMASHTMADAAVVRRWSDRWKPALNAFDMTFDGRVSAGRK